MGRQLFKSNTKFGASETNLLVHLHEICPHIVNGAILELTRRPPIRLRQTLVDTRCGCSQPHEHVETVITLEDPVGQQPSLQLLLSVDEVQRLNSRAALAW
mgnify:CR=1